MLLIRSLVVRIAGRKHHPFDAQFHHVVKELSDALRVGALKKSGIRGDAEAASKRHANSFDGLVVRTLAANRKVVMLALAIHMNRERKILTGRKLAEAFA